MEARIVVATSVLAVLVLVHPTSAQDTKEAKLVPELEELAWMIGDYEKLVTDDSYEISNLNIELSNKGQTIRASYRVMFLFCPQPSVDIGEEIRWSSEQDTIRGTYTIEGVTGAFDGLKPGQRESRTGKGVYLLKPVDGKDQWSGSGTFTASSGKQRKVSFSIARTEKGFTYTMDGKSYEFVREK